jgi:hypothetical protein
MEPLTFDSHDAGAVEAFVSRLYSRIHIGATGRRTDTHITRRLLTPEVAFDDLEYTFDVSFDAEPQRYLILCDVTSGTVHQVGEGSEETRTRVSCRRRGCGNSRSIPLSSLRWRRAWRERQNRYACSTTVRSRGRQR